MPQRRSRFGNVRQLPSKRWQARYERDGTWHSAPKTFRSKQEANDWLDDEAGDLRKGIWIDPHNSKTTFSALVVQWKPTVVNLRESTKARDFGYLEWYAIPAFGDKRIGEIDYLLLQRWVSDLSKARKPATVNKALQVVSKVLAHAVQAGLIPSNPATGVTKVKMEREEMRFLEPDQIEKLALNIDQRYRSFVYVGAYGGLRASELFGLKWNRVDLKTGKIWVTENLVEVGGRLYTEACKTKASVRSLTLPRVAQNELQGALRGNQEYIWESPKGGPVRLATWRNRVWYPAVKAAGLEGFRIHDLRHTCAALLIHAGAQPLEVSRRLGHASVRFTLDTYGHLMPGAEDRVAALLDELSGTNLARAERSEDRNTL